MHWEIEPSHDSDYDIQVMPAENENDHVAALEYATERLNEKFDAMQEGEEIKIVVRLCKGDIPDDVERDR